MYQENTEDIKQRQVKKMKKFKQLNKKLTIIYKVSKADFPKVSKYKWYVDKSNGYVCTHESKKTHSRTKIYMHRFLMNPPNGLVVDHLSNNKRDNTRKNLRICTVQDNNRNRRIRSNSQSGYTNIWLVNTKKLFKYKFSLNVNVIGKRSRSFGVFDTLEEALLMKIKVFKKYFNLDLSKKIIPEIRKIQIEKEKQRIQVIADGL